jgi:hypothetical protein
MLDRVMKFTEFHLVLIGIVSLVLGALGTAGFLYRVGFRNEGLLVRVGGGREGFQSEYGDSMSRASNKRIDMSKYRLKSEFPPSEVAPDLSNYMLKTECPAVPDLSKYVLKASIPKPQPVIIDSSSCQKDAGECPPCPRPRCPAVICPAPTKCPPPAPCPRPVCPPTVVKCKSEEASEQMVRPFLAPLNMSGFGSA